MKIIASMIFLLFVIDALALTEKAFIDKVLNQTVLELDFRAVKFLFFPRRDLNPHH
jgi:hypothetical protein